MSRSTRQACSLVLLAVMVLSGCHATQPFYLGDHGDMSHYIGVATDIEYPDVEQASLQEVTMAAPPLTLANAEFDGFWDLTLEAAIQNTLHNSKVIRLVGGSNSALDGGVVSASSPNARVDPSVLGQLSRNAVNTAAITTIYDPALQETNVASPQTQGVESALSAFDAQFSTSLFWDSTERPSNANSFPGDIENGDALNFSAEVTKRTAPGSQFSFRNNTIYNQTNSNAVANAPVTQSDWLTNFEVEARHPLLAGRGTQVNRVPVIVARIRTDVTITDFECSVRELVREVEDSYWELYLAYQCCQSQKKIRDQAHELWKVAKALVDEGQAQESVETQARQQYFEFRARVESCMADLYKAEKRLRFLMGIAASDGQLIRPVDEPTTVQVQFDWHQSLCEALCRRCELRIRKWQIKSAEMELIAARNQLLPQFDVVGLYRWLGRGDDLTNDGNSPAWSADGSDAWESLFGGDYQEWRLGGELRLPIGFRRELAGVRNAQLTLARERALLEETELEVSHQLACAMENLAAHYQLALTNHNRVVAANAELDSLERNLREDVPSTTQSTTRVALTNLILDAQRRLADAECSYYRSVVNYQLSIADVHRYKGSLLEYDNVLLAEGPWPCKAYFDAHHQARKRAASYYLDYGYTRPKVISRGPHAQQQGLDHGGSIHAPVPVEMQPGEIIITPPGNSIEEIPLPDDPINASAPVPSTLTNNATEAASPMPTVRPVTRVAAQTTATASEPAVEAQPVAAATATSAATQPVVEPKKFDWGQLGDLKPADSTKPNVEVQFR